MIQSYSSIHFLKIRFGSLLIDYVKIGFDNTFFLKRTKHGSDLRNFH